MRRDRKRVKGYWSKRKEFFSTGREARCRAAHLRSHEHIEHVKMDKVEASYRVSFSIAKWYVLELEKAGVTL